ncbi:hypothetical protein CBX98_19995 (plasmid) [Vibrio sp. T9]|nr:hypothetical protein CBX98_19995 [Vibrio sp. T9]
MESFGETRSFFASILNPNTQGFKAQKKPQFIEKALTIRNFNEHPPATKSPANKTQIQILTVAFNSLRISVEGKSLKIN